MCLGVPGKILSVSGGSTFERLARVSFGGVIKEVSLAYVPEAKVGDYVVVHVGFAISVLDEGEAGGIFRYLEELEKLSPSEEEEQ